MCRFITSLLLFCAAGVVAPQTASAAPITVPSGLNVGDTYRLAFVTSKTIDALSTEIQDYNDFVSGVAAGVPELAALGTTWSAIASTLDTHARTNTNTLSSLGFPIYRLDDTIIAVNYVDLWDGTIINPLSTFENGETASSILYAWTGTSMIGLPLTNPLGDVGGVAHLGLIIAIDKWIASGGGDFTTSHYSLYAMSGILTVLPIPGDANLDGFVDGGDYTIWADHYLLTGQSWETGDFNDDQVVDGGDYTIWADHYAPAAVATAVPEPSTLVLAGIGVAVFVAIRRRSMYR